MVSRLPPVEDLSSTQPTESCAYFEDGLPKHYSGLRARCRIPDMPWNSLQKVHGLASDAIRLITGREHYPRS